MPQAMKLSILIGADASGVKAGGAEAVDAIDDVSAAGKRAAGVLDDVADAGRRVGAGFEQTATGANATAAAITRVTTAANQNTASVRALIEATTGLSKAAADTDLRAADLQAYGAQLDALRAKYNPMFAVISRYKAEVAGIRQAHAVGALSTDEMTAAISRERQATLASIDAIKGRNAALRSAPVANSNVRNFETTNIASQGQDILVSAFGGLSPLQIALQQGTQLSSVVSQMERPLAGLAAGFASLLSPVSLVTIGVVGLSAAVIQYGADWLSTSSQSEEALQKQRDLIAEVAQKWGDATPALKAYFDEMKRAEDARQKLDAIGAAIDLSWTGAKTVVKDFSIEMDDAVSKLQEAGASTDDILTVQKAWENLKNRVSSNKASFEDVRSAQTTLAVAMNGVGIPAIDGLSDAFANLSKIIDEASGRSKRFAADAGTDLDRWAEAQAERVKKGQAYTDALLKIQQAEHDLQNPSNIPAGIAIPVPANKPSLLDYDPDEEANKKLATARQKAADTLAQQTKQYNDYLQTQDRGIAQTKLEISLIGATAAERQRALAIFDADQKARELGLATSSKEAELLRQKAAAQADVNQQLAGQKALQQQDDDISRLQLEISLVGASADARAKSIAAYETEKQIRDQGIDSMSREADALRAGAQARAELQLQLERQQAAYQSLQQAEGSAIDTLVTGSGSLKDRLRSAADSALQYFEQIAVANPLKNMLTGTNLPTIGDFLTGKPASPLASTSTQAMTVTAGAVYINGAPIGAGLPFTGANPGIPAASNPLAGATATVSRLLPAANQNTPPTDVEAYIRQAALARGIDPNTALAVARSEGGLTSWNMQSRVPLPGGGLEPSFGPYQLYMNGGLGSQFQQQTGLDPRLAQNGPQGVDFALDYAKTHGWEAFHGAANSGISNWQGINPGVDTATSSMSKLSQTATATSTQIDKMGTGAIDASKALTDGNNSLVGSITKASQTAAQPAAPTAPAGVPAVGSGTAAGGGILSSITGAIGGMLKGVVGLFSSLFKGVGSIFGSLFGGLFAKGDVFLSGAVIPFANGTVIDKPTLFPMAGGRTGLMGEAGEEAIMPLRRGADGKLGVVSAMPRQTREGGAVHFNFTSSIKAEVHGNGDAELHAQMEAISKRHSEDTVRQIRNGFPSMVEDYQRNPNVRRYG